MPRPTLASIRSSSAAFPPGPSSRCRWSRTTSRWAPSACSPAATGSSAPRTCGSRPTSRSCSPLRWSARTSWRASGAAPTSWGSCSRSPSRSPASSTGTSCSSRRSRAPSSCSTRTSPPSTSAKATSCGSPSRKPRKERRTGSRRALRWDASASARRTTQCSAGWSSTGRTVSATRCARRCPVRRERQAARSASPAARKGPSPPTRRASRTRFPRSSRWLSPTRGSTPRSGRAQRR